MRARGNEQWKMEQREKERCRGSGHGLWAGKVKQTGKSCGDRREDGWILDGVTEKTDGEMQKEILLGN